MVQPAERHGESTTTASQLREGFKKHKKIWIYPYLGGWVFQDGDNIHEKQKNTCLLNPF